MRLIPLAFVHRERVFGTNAARVQRVLVTVGVVVLVAIVLVVVTIRDVWFALGVLIRRAIPASSSRKRWRAARSASAHAKTSARAKRIPRFRFDLGARAIIGIGEKAPHTVARLKNIQQKNVQQKSVRRNEEQVQTNDTTNQGDARRKHLNS